MFLGPDPTGPSYASPIVQDAKHYDNPVGKKKNNKNVPNHFQKQSLERKTGLVYHILIIQTQGKGLLPCTEQPFA